jgi:hypothetical protein
VAEQHEQHDEDDDEEDAREELASKSVLSTEPTPTGNAMFTGLHLSVASSVGHESQTTQSRTGSSSSLINDEHSTDSPMTIHELSDHHASLTDDENLSGSRTSHESSFADISFTATSLTTVTTTTTAVATVATSVAPVASDSLFGGLSLMTPAVPPAMLAEPNDSGDESKQEL